jgi:hypothetical protein
MALASEKIGQVAVITIIPKATSSGKYVGRSLYSYRSLTKRQARVHVDVIVFMFTALLSQLCFVLISEKSEITIFMSII